MKKVFTILVVAMMLMLTGCFDDSDSTDNLGEEIHESGHRKTDGSSVRIEEVTPVRISEPSPPRTMSRPCPYCSGRGYTRVHISVPNYSGTPDESGRISRDEWVEQSCGYCSGTGIIEIDY